MTYFNLPQTGGNRGRKRASDGYKAPHSYPSAEAADIHPAPGPERLLFTRSVQRLDGTGAITREGKLDFCHLVYETNSAFTLPDTERDTETETNQQIAIH